MEILSKKMKIIKESKGNLRFYTLPVGVQKQLASPQPSNSPDRSDSTPAEGGIEAGNIPLLPSSPQALRTFDQYTLLFPASTDLLTIT